MRITTAFHVPPPTLSVMGTAAMPHVIHVMVTLIRTVSAVQVVSCLMPRSGALAVTQNVRLVMVLQTVTA
jgi:hypothetical protein